MAALLPGDVLAGRKAAWIEEDGLVTLLVPRFSDGLVGRVLSRLAGSNQVRIRLDRLGSYVWLKLDGETSLSEIARRLEESFPDSAEAAEDRVSLFLTKLYREGWITLARRVGGSEGGMDDDEAEG